MARAPVCDSFFRPSGADAEFVFRLPTACAVGCILSPLRGFVGDGSSSAETNFETRQLQEQKIKVKSSGALHTLPFSE
jgi:hypothetical protein